VIKKPQRGGGQGPIWDVELLDGCKNCVKTAILPLVSDLRGTLYYSIVQYSNNNNNNNNNSF
jgi:hypothetical protein